jgi:hypothetical protein
MSSPAVAAPYPSACTTRLGAILGACLRVCHVRLNDFGLTSPVPCLCPCRCACDMQRAYAWLTTVSAQGGNLYPSVVFESVVTSGTPLGKAKSWINTATSVQAVIVIHIGFPAGAFVVARNFLHWMAVPRSFTPSLFAVLFHLVTATPLAHVQRRLLPRCAYPCDMCAQVDMYTRSATHSPVLLPGNSFVRL